MTVNPGPTEGTTRALAPISDSVLAWVAEQRRHLETVRRLSRSGQDWSDDLRRIELCALVTRDVAAFNALYTPEGRNDGPPPSP